MCGIAGLIHRDGATSVGKEMTAMLLSLRHRGPDSTGFAIYGTSTPDEYVMRLKLAEAEDLTKDHHIRHKIRERQAEVDNRLSELGAETIEVSEATPYAFRYHLRYAGDTRRLATELEQIEGAEVLSFGSALELIKDLGDATQVSEQYGLGTFKGTHGIGHTRMATESDVDIRSAHPYWAYPYNDIAVVHNGQITNYWIMRREMERLGHRFMSNCDSELLAVYTANNLEQGATLEDSLKSLDQGYRRRVHLSGRHRVRARHGQGHHGREADGAVRERESRRACLGGGRYPRAYSARDRHFGSV